MPELTTEVIARPDGYISMPIVDDLQAVGRTPAELASDIESALAVQIRAPIVTVIIRSFTG